MPRISIFALLVAAAVALAPAARAEAAREIGWEDLVPPAPPLADLFKDLPTDLVVELYGVIGVRAQKEQGLISSVSRTYEIALESEHRLKSAGVDVEARIRQYEAREAEIRRRGAQVVGALDGQTIRLAGYALPLEFDGTKVREFLLVPYVGACIHVPPPPPNQMVFVRLDEPTAVGDMFAPVRIDGRVTAKQATNSLFLRDGSAPIVSGYTVESARVEPYAGN